MKRYYLIIALVLVAMLCFTSCWPFSENYDIRGSWNLITMGASEGTLFGTMECAGSLESGTVTGRLTGQTIDTTGSYQVQSKNVTLTFTTGMSDDLGGVMAGIFTDKDSISGTWQDTQKSGPWSATRR